MLILDAIILSGMKMMKCNQKYKSQAFLNVQNVRKRYKNHSKWSSCYKKNLKNQLVTKNNLKDI